MWEGSTGTCRYHLPDMSPFLKNYNVFGFDVLLTAHLSIMLVLNQLGDRGSTVVKVLCYKSEGCWFDPSWCQWVFH